LNDAELIIRIQERDDNVKGLSSYGKDAGNLLIDVELTVYVEG